ncbi:MAG: endonuclease/exonuclease/phosphatase family protein [candidate division NC10 bacterium]|nr:endonuclease/exonuclease/phosphatase family protein [candidate division NC10 bacterium]
MTYNLYLGADLLPVLSAPDLDAVKTAVNQVWAKVQATDFPARAKEMADQIEKKNPDLIGLQEAVLWGIQSPGDFPPGANTPATDVAFDFVNILLDELTLRGLNYAVVATSTGFDVELPSSTGDDIRLTDREVILARTDLPPSEFLLWNADAGNFITNLDVTVAGLPVTILRGWASVDVFLRGNLFRFVTTHLEVYSEFVQVTQANELVAGPGFTALPLVFAGDFNSNADGSGTATHGILIAAGFVDAWDLAGSGAGFTCCQDEDLLNLPSALSRRIDLVLFYGAVAVKNAQVVGKKRGNRTPSGLWPSDHGGVVAKFRIPD